jgi:hypothetical protein
VAAAITGHAARRSTQQGAPQPRGRRPSGRAGGDVGKSSLGDAMSSLGDAKSSLGDAKISLG